MIRDILGGYNIGNLEKRSWSKALFGHMADIHRVAMLCIFAQHNDMREISIAGKLTDFLNTVAFPWIEMK